MNIPGSILQTLAVGAASFGFFALVVSYVRYRKMQLIAEDCEDEVLPPASAVMLILKALRECGDGLPLMLLRIRQTSSADTGDLRDHLRKCLRRSDRLLRVANGSVLVLLQCPEEQLGAVARRLRSRLEEGGFPGGTLSLWSPELSTGKILAWMTQAPETESGPGWKQDPSEWKTPDTESVFSPSVDPLTGVLKSDRVPRAFRRMLAQCRRMGMPVTVALVEVDELESYIRSYGKEAGDLILKQTAKLLMTNCRETDLIGRGGGNTFLLALEGGRENMLAAALRMSEVIKNAPLSVGDHQIRFSAAFGLASMPEDGKNPVLLMDQADLALQDAKRRGRGVCVAYQPALKPAAGPATTGENRPESF